MKHLNKCLCGLALAGALVSTNAYAETEWEGFEMRVAVTAPIVDQHLKMEISASGDDFDMTAGSKYERAEHIMAGVAGTLSFGYRFGMFGVYVDQELGGAWWTGETGDGYKPTFVGGTYLTGRLLLALRHDVELDFGIGVGTMYSAGDKNNAVKLIIDKEGDHSAAFAIKAGIGLTYYLIPNTVGIGINFDYNLGLNIVSQNQSGEDDFGDSVDAKATLYHLVHLMNPGIHVVAQF